jgi:hypothetical protein
VSLFRVFNHLLNLIIFIYAGKKKDNTMTEDINTCVSQGNPPPLFLRIDTSNFFDTIEASNSVIPEVDRTLEPHIVDSDDLQEEEEEAENTFNVEDISRLKPHLDADATATTDAHAMDVAGSGQKREVKSPVERMKNRAKTTVPQRNARHLSFAIFIHSDLLKLQLISTNPNASEMKSKDTKKSSSHSETVIQESDPQFRCVIRF